VVPVPAPDFVGRSSVASWTTRADPELAVRVAEVHLDRLDGHEQRLRDLGVGGSAGRKVHDPPLARRQCVEPDV
jgi:hypothetical protein